MAGVCDLDDLVCYRGSNVLVSWLEMSRNMERTQMNVVVIWCAHEQTAL